MRESFETCLTLLWGMAPPCSRTPFKLGLTAKTLAAWRGCKIASIDLEELHKGTAAAILDVWFWRGIRGDELPKGIDFAAFAHAVYSTPKQCVLDLKHVLKTTRGNPDMDGVTLRALESANPEHVIAGICSFAKDREHAALVAERALAMLPRAPTAEGPDFPDELT
jgi:lysozyme family protein